MADNPIKYSDFIQPDSSIKDLIKQLEKVLELYKEMASKLKQEASTLEDSMKKSSNATMEGRQATKKAATEAERLAKEYEKLNHAKTDAAKKIAKLKVEQQKQNQINKLTAKLNKSAEGSYNKLSAQYSLNKIRLNAMSKAQRHNTKAGKELEKQTAEIYAEMKRLQEATGKHTLSVGDYEKGWKGLKEQLGQVPGATGKAVGGFDNMGAAAKRFLANPIVLVISLIVGGLYALFNAFKRTKNGSDLLSKGMAALDGIMSALIGVADKLFKVLIKVFNDPQQALKDLGNAIINNLVNRLKAVLDVFKIFGRALKALWERDIPALNKAAKDAGRAIIQLNTGLDAEQQKEFASAINKTTKEIEAQARAFAKLEAERLKIRRGNRELEKQLESITTQTELSRNVADDATRSFKEREEAAKKASALEISRAGIETTIARNNLALINKELDLRQSNGEEVEDLLDKQIEAYKALTQAQRTYTLAQLDDTKRSSELRQDRLERDLDILIDGFDNQKTINEKIINDTSRTFDERKVKLQETRDLFEKSFAKQIETIQKFTKIQIDSNDLIGTSDAVLLNQKIRSLGLSEIIEGRLLEIIRDRKSATQDLADAERKLNADEKKLNEKKLNDDIRFKNQEFNNQKDLLSKEFDLRNTEIDLLKETEAEKTKLRIQAEIDRWKKILQLNATFGNQLSDVEVKTIENTIQKLETQLNKADKEGTDIYSALGFKLDDEGKQAIADTSSLIIDNINSVVAARIEAIDRSLEKIREEGDEIKSRYDQEIEARNNGYANQVLSTQRELELNEQKEQQALKQKEKAQKAQERIDTANQITGLITSSVQIYKSLSGIPIVGPALAAAAIGAMFANFTASKLKARTLAKEKLEHGGWEILDGGSHASGKDIPIGTTKKGKQRTAEGGELLAVINKKNTRKYKPILPKVIDSLNSGTFEKSFAIDTNGGSEVNNFNYQTIDLKTIESDVNAIRKQNEHKQYIDSKGRLVKKYKNLTRIYETI